jgi:peptidoglycan/LPS O-acetylase OafA/YrhL
VFYFELAQVGQPAMAPSDHLPTLIDDVVRGVGWYHLYFLIVSLQFYVLFPLVLKGLRTARRHHWTVFGVSLAAQIGVTMALTYLPAPAGNTVLGFLWANQGTLVISYQFYLVAGCLAAFHFDTFQGWITAHSRLVLWLVGGTALFAQAWYWVNVLRGVNPWEATGVLEPEMIPWFCTVVLGLYLLGSVWLRRTSDGGRSRRLVSVLSARSFGVFLVHPAFIWLYGYLGNGWLPAHLTPLVYTATTYVFAVGCSLVLVEVLIRSLFSKVLIGRDRLRPARQRAAAGQR